MGFRSCPFKQTSNFCEGKITGLVFNALLVNLLPWVDCKLLQKATIGYTTIGLSVFNGVQFSLISTDYSIKW